MLNPTRQTAAALALMIAGHTVLAQPTLPNPDPTPFFKAVDRNRDGCASLAEWRRAGAPQSAYQMLKDAQGCVTLARMKAGDAPPGIDLNGDGKITLAEFKAFDKKMSAQMKRDAAARARTDGAGDKPARR